jgi:hypothetical protein
MPLLKLDRPWHIGRAAGHRSMLTARERLIAWQLAFFIVIAYAIELPWLLSSAELPRLENLWGRIWAFYGQSDRGYYDRVSSFELGLESFHIFVTQWLYVWMLWAVMRRWAYRHVLEVAIGSYVAYSTVVYLVGKHLTGYALMPEHEPRDFLILYLANLPWVSGNLYIAVDGAGELVRLTKAARLVHAAGGA